MEAILELGNDTDWKKNFKVHGESSLHDHEQTIKTILVRGVRRTEAIRKPQSSWGAQLRTVTRLLIEMMAGKVLLMRCQVDIGNILLKPEEK